MVSIFLILFFPLGIHGSRVLLSVPASVILALRPAS